MRLATRLLTSLLAGLALLPAAATTYRAQVQRAAGAAPQHLPASASFTPGSPAPTPPLVGLKPPAYPAPRPAALSFQAGAPALTLFPNPAHGLLTVQLSAQHGPDYKLRLSNVLGREVRLLPLPLATAASGLPLDVTGLPAGLYFCSLLVNDKAVSTNRVTLL